MGYTTDFDGCLDISPSLKEKHRTRLLEFADERHEGSNFPGYWCQWIPTGDGTGLEWDGGEKFYNYVEWLEFLVRRFLEPWGYILNGEIRWRGEEFNDVGVIIVKDNDIKTTQGFLQVFKW